MRVHVECYSGWKADERPIRFRLDDRDYQIQEIIGQWYGPDGTYFKVRAGGVLRVLRHDPSNDAWTLESAGE